MKPLLICPTQRPPVKLLSDSGPLAALPLLGQSLLEYWLSYWALAGAREVLLVVHECPETICALAGTGARWGLKLKTIVESRELTPAQALLKFASELDPVPAPNSVVTLDHFPGVPERPLFASYDSWYKALVEWMPCALTPERVGVHQARPGVWVNAQAHIAPQAQLRPPCWIGRHALIGAGATIGPGSIIEDGAFVEPGAEIVQSWVGPDTFVGKFARLAHSLARGSTLIDWQSGSSTMVPDPFLLCALRTPKQRRAAGWLARLNQLYARGKGESGLAWKDLLLNRRADG